MRVFFFLIVSLNCDICCSCRDLCPNKRQLQTVLVSPWGENKKNIFFLFLVCFTSLHCKIFGINFSYRFPPIRCLLTWMLKKAFSSHTKRFPVYMCLASPWKKVCPNDWHTVWLFSASFPTPFSTKFKMEPFLAFMVFLLVASELDCVCADGPSALATLPFDFKHCRG